MCGGAQRVAAPWCVALLALLASAWSGPASARNFVEVGRGRGLEAGMVVALAFDQSGFLWVGTREGLYRYDGYEARVFRHDPADPASLGDSDVRALHVARDGTLWIGTSSGGLARYDAAGGYFQNFRHDPANATSLSDNLVYGIGEDAVGALWVTTRKGANRLRRDRSGFEHFVHDAGVPGSLSSDWTFVVHLGRSGSLWIGTVGAGLNRWDAARQRFEHFDLARLSGGSAGRNDVFTLHERDGKVWAGTREGVVVLDVATRTAKSLDLGSRDGAQPMITAAYADDRERLWLGTMADGVLVVDTRSGAWLPARQGSIGAPGNLPAQPQISLAGYAGQLFVGTWGDGVYRTPLAEEAFTLIGGDTATSGLRVKDVTAILPTEQPGQPWLGTFGGGPQRADVARGFVAAGAAAASDPLRSAGVLSIARDARGLLHAGTTLGVFGFDADGRSLQRDPISPVRAAGLGPGYVTAVLSDGTSGLWVGQAGSGLSHRAADGQFRVLPLESDDVTDLERWHGTIWVGTATGGLQSCNPSTWTCRRPIGAGVGTTLPAAEHVTDLFVDRDDRLWVATNGGGVTLLAQDIAGRVSSMRRWTEADGLLGDEVMAIAQDSDGSFWFSTRRGLSRVDPRRGLVVNHVLHSGLPTGEFNARAAAADATHLYFGSLAGLVALPLGSPLQPRPPPTLRVTGLERIVQGTAERRAAEPASRVRLAYDEGLAVRFAVLDYSELPHEYQYRLEADDAWTTIGARRDLLFVKLPPGHHELELRGRDVFAQWGTSSVLGIDVVPAFWMTAWFRALVAGMLLLLVLGLHRARLAALRRRNVELEHLKNDREAALQRAEASQRQLGEAYEGLRGLMRRVESAKEDERLSIARELHDQLGQSLTAAKLNLQMLKRWQAPAGADARVDETVAMIDGMIRQVRDLSLALRPPLLDEAGLVAALEHDLEAVAERSGIEVRFDAPATLADAASTTARLTVFRIVQEAVNNVLRHAAAQRIDVRLRRAGNGLRVEIEDDGVGFDPADVRVRARRGQHLGLLGMAERAEASGGWLSVDSRLGAGSRIEAWIPLEAESGHAPS